MQNHPSFVILKLTPKTIVLTDLVKRGPYFYKRPGDKHGRLPNKLLRLQKANSYTKNLKKNNFQKIVEYSHTGAATSAQPGGLRAAEIIIFPEMEPAATPEEKISTNKVYIIVFQDIKEE